MQPGIGASGGSIITMAVDTTVDVPILFQANPALATDTVDLHEYLVELTRPARSATRPEPETTPSHRRRPWLRTPS